MLPAEQQIMQLYRQLDAAARQRIREDIAKLEATPPVPLEQVIHEAALLQNEISTRIGAIDAQSLLDEVREESSWPRL
jgi:glutamine synthetase